METTRQNKIARLLQKDLSDIFQTELRNAFGKVMVTITTVRVSSDLSVAKIYVSIFGVNEKDAVLKKITEHTKDIRRSLGNKVKNQLRIIPNLEFFIDDSLDYLENIENLLKQ